MKSSPPQQDAIVKALTADFLVLGQSLYHRATLPPAPASSYIFDAISVCALFNVVI